VIKQNLIGSGICPDLLYKGKDMDIQKPTEEQLRPLINEACVNQTAEEWIEKILEAIKSVIQKKPLRYRGYGPYWWLIKKMLIDRSFLEFGEHLDREWVDALDYGSDKLNLAAAFAYEDARFETVNIYGDTHTMATATGSVEYISADKEMEVMALIVSV
jgi:hypothetical protein